MIKYFGSKNLKKYVKIDKKEDNVPSSYNELSHAIEKSQTFSLNNRKRIEEYALLNPDKNMIDIYRHFNFPVPETEEEKSDPRFEIHILYKFNSKGEKVPRENIFYNTKYNKGYKNPLDKSYSFCDAPQGNNYEFEHNKESDLRQLKRLNNTINSTQKKIGRKSFIDFDDMQKNQKDIEKIQFTMCIRYYYQYFKKKEITEITKDDITSLGHVYYVIKAAEKYPELFNNPFEICQIWKMDNNNTINNKEVNLLNINVIHKEKPKYDFITTLIKNWRIADINFGYLTSKVGFKNIVMKNLDEIKMNSQNENDENGSKTESQKLLEDFEKLKLKSQMSKSGGEVSQKSNYSFLNFYIPNNNQIIYENKGNSLLYDAYRIILILKGKRIITKDLEGKKIKRKFYFKFYLEEKLLNKVEVIYNQNVSKMQEEEFKKIMKSIKENEEVIMVFAYNPSIYFNYSSGNYEGPIGGGVECVYYIDSSKENPNVEKIFKEINQN